MTEPGRRWSVRFRLVLITIMLLVGIAVTMVSALLVAEVDESWTPGSVTRGVLSAVLALFSGIYVNLVWAAVIRLWRQPESPDLTVRAVIDKAHERLRRTPRRIGIVLTVVAIVAVGLVLRPAPPPDVGLEKGELVVMMARDESQDDLREMLIGLWNQTHPDNRARIAPVPGEPDQQNQTMVNDAKPGGPNAADVYVLDVVWMEQFARLGYVRALDRATTPELDDFVDKVLETCTYEGKLWALPLNTDVGMLYYRSDVPGAKKPATWGDYFGAAASAAAAADGTPGVEAANAAQLGNEEVLTVTALEAMWAAGGEAFNRNGEVTQNEDKTAVQLEPADLKGLEQLAAAAGDPDIVLTAEARSTTDDTAVEAFAAGRTMYMRNWPVAYDKLVDRVEFEVAAPPTPSVLGGQNIAVSATTDKPRAARALIEFLTSSSSQLILSEMGGFAPTRQSAYDNTSRGELQEVRTALNNARRRPVTEHYVEFSRVFREGIVHALDSKGGLKPGWLQQLSEILNK